MVVFLFLLTLLSYLSIFVSPAVFWPIGLINYIIPLFIGAQLILICIILFKRKWRKLIIFPIIALSVGFYFIDTTFNIPFESNDTIDETSFTVLSFNARYFRKRKGYSKFQPETIHWVVDEPSGIKCFQEYSSNPTSEQTDVFKRLTAKGFDSHILKLENDLNNRGIAIFSKFPIINRGTIILNDLEGSYQNNCIFTDVLIKGDTVRVYNFHLKSMGLALSKFKRPSQISNESKETVTKLGSASSKRAVELDLIIESIKNCPYPYILACDFNELPYGNNYYKLRMVAGNTFEEVGSGFGFTFNSVLFFIRIDHQFYSKGIVADNFEVIRDVRSSDHFPIKGWYSLQR